MTALSALRTRLEAALGKEGYSDAPEDCLLMGQDVWSRSTPAAFVVAPADLGELRMAVAAAHEAGVPLDARGGGMSYTGGYAPDREGVGVIDFRRATDRTLLSAPGAPITWIDKGRPWPLMPMNAAAAGSPARLA